MDAFPEVAHWSDERTLHDVRRVRQVFDHLNRQIVQESCRRFLGEVNGDDCLLEFGAGDGQLRTWLPTDLHDRVLHTEPSEVFGPIFSQKHPEAQFQQASIYELPMATGSQAGVISLCVLDALRDPERARDEIRRVLRPNGYVLHFLDLGLACLDGVFQEELARGAVPVPNFLEEGHQIRILDDYAVCDRTQLVAVINYLNSTGHPSGAALADYLRHIEGSPLAASQHFMSISNNPSDRWQLADHLGTAMRLTAAYPGMGCDWQTRSSLDFLQKRLADLFSESAGFQVCCSAILSAREWHEPMSELPPGCRHFARYVGQVVARRIAEPFEIGECVASAGPPVSDSQLLLETGMFVFAATKTEKPDNT